MEALEYTLILLACVIVSSVLGRFVRHVALPLVQIAVGFVVALIAPDFVEVQVSSELFLVLFIAPLLFDEARRSSRRQLWQNKWSIVSLAVGMVFVSVLCVGFVLNVIVPSIPLAAAFACAAALAPTDAAAVGALGSTVGLRKRQEVVLSGESLVNDASGIVSFHFAVAAVVTGAFSVVDAAGEFGILFFGGVGVGLAFGLLAYGSMKLLRRLGYEDTVIHVLYEVFTPFFVFLLAEWLNVSGILAVVAAGLVMSENAPRLTSIDAAKRQMVSDNFWKVIVFLINGIIFVMLGTQLPLALVPSVAETYSIPMLIGIVLLITLVMMACRFGWLSVMELFHKDEETGQRGAKHGGGALKDALVMTLAGPKGAVTLSIIFTIPMYLTDGSVFPQRSLIIFLTAGVILATLLMANFLLPLLAPRHRESNELCVHKATLRVLETTIDELQDRIDDGEDDEYIPAPELTKARYQTRLDQEREAGPDAAAQVAAQNALITLRPTKQELQTTHNVEPTMANEVDANALIIELDCIRHMQESGEISEGVARQLRRRVYALQGALEGY